MIYTSQCSDWIIPLVLAGRFCVAARSEEGAYREYVTDERRSPPRKSARPFLKGSPPSGFFVARRLRWPASRPRRSLNPAKMGLPECSLNSGLGSKVLLLPHLWGDLNNRGILLRRQRRPINRATTNPSLNLAEKPWPSNAKKK